MHNATAIITGSANQWPNTPCIMLWIDVTFRGLENSYNINLPHQSTNNTVFCASLLWPFLFVSRFREMDNYFSIDNNLRTRLKEIFDNNVKFEVIPYIDLRQTYLQMICYTKKKGNFQLAISKKQSANSKKQ